MKNFSLDVCIPTYNRPTDLGVLVDTVPKEVGVCISNNGSIISPDNFNREVLIVNNPKTIPMFENWNAAGRMSNAEYVFIISDDDIYESNAFDIISNAIKAHSDVDVFLWGHNYVDKDYSIMSSHTFIDDEFKLFQPGELFSAFPYSVPFRMPAICIRREFAEKLGYFNTDMKITASDSEFLHRCFLLGNCYVGPEIIAGYRVWENSLTNATNGTEAWFLDLNIWCENILKLANDNNKMAFVPSDFRERIMCDNAHSAISTMKKNSKSIREKLNFLLMMRNKRFVKSPLNLAKLIAKVLIK